MDESVEIIKKYSPWIKHWVSESDRGQSHALNKGFSGAKGSIYGWLNSDDLYCKDVLCQIGGQTHKAEVIVGQSEYVDHNLKFKWKVPIWDINFLNLLRYPEGLYLPQPSVFFSAYAIKSVGVIREDLHYVMDLDLWIRLSRKFKFHRIDEKLSLMRFYDSTKTSSGAANIYHEYEEILEYYKKEIGDSQYFKLRKKTNINKSAIYIAKSNKEIAKRNRKKAIKYLLSSAVLEYRGVFSMSWMRTFFRILIGPKKTNKFE